MHIFETKYKIGDIVYHIISADKGMVLDITVSVSDLSYIKYLIGTDIHSSSWVSEKELTINKPVL